MVTWRHAESVKKSLNDWLGAVEAEHQGCDVDGGNLLTAVRASENYQSRVEEHRDKLDKLRHHAEQLQQLTGVSQLPELEENIHSIEERLVDAEQRNDKLSKELQQINGTICELV